MALEDRAAEIVQPALVERRAQFPDSRHDRGQVVRPEALRVGHHLRRSALRAAGARADELVGPLDGIPNRAVRRHVPPVVREVGVRGRVEDVDAEQGEERKLDRIPGAVNMDRQLSTGLLARVLDYLPDEGEVVVAGEKGDEASEREIRNVELEQLVGAFAPQVAEAATLLDGGEDRALDHRGSLADPLHGRAHLLRRHAARLARRRDQVERRDDVCADRILEADDRPVVEEQLAREALERAGVRHDRSVEPDVLLQRPPGGESLTQLAALVEEVRVHDARFDAERIPLVRGDRGERLLIDGKEDRQTELVPTRGPQCPLAALSHRQDVTVRPMSLDDVLDAEARAIESRYRVDREAALAALRKALRDAALAAAVEQEVARGSVRGAAVRKLAKEARRHVYHDLRRYTTDTAAQEQLSKELEAAIGESRAEAVDAIVGRLLETHASTRERLPSYDAFFALVRAVVGEPATVVDLGAGLHPLTCARSRRCPDVYVAVERDEAATEIVRAFAPSITPSRLLVYREDVGTVDWGALTNAAGVREFELAYLLKLVPVLNRQQPEALGNVALVPARTLVITGSREALTRRQDISRREDRVLRRFIDSLSPADVERAETEDEIVYIVRR